jgi:hypothetical protein
MSDSTENPNSSPNASEQSEPAASGDKQFTPNLDSTNDFEVLGVDPNTSQDQMESQVNKAFRKLSLQHHPDRNRNDPSSTERFQKINNAHTNLLKSFQPQNNASNTSSKNEHDNFTAAPKPANNAPKFSTQQPKRSPAQEDFSQVFMQSWVFERMVNHHLYKNPNISNNNWSTDFLKMVLKFLKKFDNEHDKKKYLNDYVLLVPEITQQFSNINPADIQNYQTHREDKFLMVITLDTGSEITLFKGNGAMLLSDNKPETLAAAGDLMKQQELSANDYTVRTADPRYEKQVSDELRQNEQMNRSYTAPAA